MKSSSVQKALSSGARIGAIELANCPGVSINTPALLISTRKGLPYFTPPDLLPSLPSPDSHLLQVSPLHFLEGISPATIGKIGGIHKLIGLGDYGVVAVPRDNVHSLPECKGASKLGASFETPCGRLLIKPKDYVEMISCMRPNIWATLADEVPAWVTDKRNRTSVDRTLRWLDDCLALNPAVGSVFGAIVGGTNLDERKRCAEEVAKRNVAGYWIGGFGLGEAIDERPALLRAIVDVLQDEKPRMICGLGLPEEILQGIAAGVDLFDSSYIYTLTLGGFALTFSLDKNGNQDNFKLSQRGSDSTKINLRATEYRLDMSPIVDGCSCHTCQNYTKAYINHLYNVHEMLAQTLLEIHNAHHYLRFFRVIREAIQDGRFEEYRLTFTNSRREHYGRVAVC
ncbi:putative tRNA-guanine(34) transglycosylase [Medicago truncatula]|uniref:Queuine tRNA-ribosyltransferase accessory subunit 2 n=1 Tax=Medicago truncatula TaxID=3880 RepID=G7JLX9_MEDTR|nr:queuine tRNA-ribosyltransferase accessory subunit 2 [Medicago truncatula]AES87621.2 queuine tRNA-ribosyltransferase [Medicago truncatula]RHN59493.1 putative tRNA-guanine(34) transglycosylase [Medicago truncatula]